MKFVVNRDGRETEINLNSTTGTIDGKELEYEITRDNNGRYLARVGNKSFEIYDVTLNGYDLSFQYNGKAYNVTIKDEQALLLESMGYEDPAASGEGELQAPMPGKILEILVSEGDEIKAGQPVIILEAMKMENELKAPVDGTIEQIAVETGQSVEKNELLIQIG